MSTPTPGPFEVIVTLESTSPLRMTFHPEDKSIDTGVQNVTWTMDPGGNKFKFEAVSFHRTHPFANVVVGDKEINAVDNNKKPEVHQYNVLISVGSSYYNSRDRKNPPPSGDPTIRNK